jgi:hypothetical protein
MAFEDEEIRRMVSNDLDDFTYSQMNWNDIVSYFNKNKENLLVNRRQTKNPNR